MAAPTLGQIMTALDTRLATITTLNHGDFIANQVVPPAAMVALPDINEYRSTMGRGKVEITYRVLLIVSSTLDRAGQMELADYISWTGTKSIPLAIEADRQLGNLVDDCVVDSFRSWGIDEFGVIGYYGGEFTGRVIANGV